METELHSHCLCVLFLFAFRFGLFLPCSHWYRNHYYRLVASLVHIDGFPHVQLIDVCLWYKIHPNYALHSVQVKPMAVHHRACQRYLSRLRGTFVKFRIVACRRHGCRRRWIAPATNCHELGENTAKYMRYGKWTQSPKRIKLRSLLKRIKYRSKCERRRRTGIKMQPRIVATREKQKKIKIYNPIKKKRKKEKESAKATEMRWESRRRRRSNRASFANSAIRSGVFDLTNMHSQQWNICMWIQNIYDIVCNEVTPLTVADHEHGPRTQLIERGVASKKFNAKNNT